MPDPSVVAAVGATPIASEHRGSNLRASSVRVEVSGVGQAFVWADRRLDADVGGEGRIVYRGDPAIEGRLGEDDRIVPIETETTGRGG